MRLVPLLIAMTATIAGLVLPGAEGTPTNSSAAPWFANMDFGPVLNDTITAPMPAGNIAIKGHAVRLRTGGTMGGMCFDADLLRFSAGWTGGYLALRGVAYEGKHGPHGPDIAGTQIFGTPARPGWVLGEDQDGPDRFSDPRSEPFGPIPRGQAHFAAEYLYGEQAVFAYTVGTGSVLELPGFEAGGKAVSRTMRLTDLPAATVLLAEVSGAIGTTAGPSATLTGDGRALSVGLVGAPAGARLVVRDGRILLSLPATAKAWFKVVYAPVPAADLAGVLAQATDLTDPATLTTGGPARYPQTVETIGELGTGSGAYVVDTITLPEKNPWQSRMRIGGHDFFADGRAAVCTWNGDVWIVSGIDAGLGKLTWRRFATGLHQPLGLRIVDDVIYVTTRDGIERLRDLNHDGEADVYENFNNDVHTTPAFHEFPFDLWNDAAGNFYFAKAGPVRSGGRGWETIAAHHGCLLKVSKDGQKLEVVATGLRAPNGMSVGPGDQITTGDNEGTWTPTSRINLVTSGAFLGVPPLAHRTPEPTECPKPLVWIPHNIDNSCGGQAWTLDAKWGLPAGQLLHLAYGSSSLFVVGWGPSEGLPQAAVVRFPLTFNTGIMRARFNPHDGQLYVSGLRGWQTNGAKDGGFQRVRYTGKPANLPIAYVVKKDGVVLTFSDPLDPKLAMDPGNYAAETWNYLWTGNYGSPEVTLHDPKKKGHDQLTVAGATVSADGRTVFLRIPQLEPAMQLKVSWKIAAADGTPLTQDCYATVNQLGTAVGP
jgi:hypothetical protein